MSRPASSSPERKIARPDESPASSSASSFAPSPSDTTIARLGADDASAYRALMLDAYARHPDAFTATVDERGPLPLEWWIARVERELVVGAWQAGRLVGAAGLVAETRPKTWHKATLIGMVVDDASTGRGIGASLVNTLLDRACARPPWRIVQLTVTDGNDAARTLYERCGFAAFGTEPFAVKTDDGFAAKVHMWIDLETRSRAPRTGIAVATASSHA